MKAKFLFFIGVLTLLHYTLAIDADPKNFPKIVEFAKQSADKKASQGFRFLRVDYLSISDVENGKQYHLWLLYLDRVGVQQYFELTIYENPWGELVLYDINKNSFLSANKRFL